MYFQKSVIFLVRFNFLFCVEDHHSPLESDLTRSFCTADRHLPLENDMEVYVQIYLFWSLKVRRFWFEQKWKKFFGNRFQTIIFFSKERIKFPYKNPYILIFIILFLDVDQPRSYLMYVRYFRYYILYPQYMWRYHLPLRNVTFCSCFYFFSVCFWTEYY